MMIYLLKVCRSGEFMNFIVHLDKKVAFWSCVIPPILLLLLLLLLRIATRQLVVGRYEASPKSKNDTMSCITPHMAQ
jgi:hypothetical protein